MYRSNSQSASEDEDKDETSNPRGTRQRRPHCQLRIAIAQGVAEAQSCPGCLQSPPRDSTPEPPRLRDTRLPNMNLLGPLPLCAPPDCRAVELRAVRNWLATQVFNYRDLRFERCQRACTELVLHYKYQVRSLGGVVQQTEDQWVHKRCQMRASDLCAYIVMIDH
eukprot:m51a1_g13431 hypothetical protein (165) ;mRNA; f:1079-1892